MTSFDQVFSIRITEFSLLRPLPGQNTKSRVSERQVASLSALATALIAALGGGLHRCPYPPHECLHSITYLSTSSKTRPFSFSKRAPFQLSSFLPIHQIAPLFD